ncbi:P-type ATPase [Trema orientale]|uniref:P-type ATPase n=1 Tax=Trema orientale TaxID=63057 RepID=A0A2P5E8N6_TREOI|nr:P-type ATPase [Trema orientale]
MESALSAMATASSTSLFTISKALTRGSNNNNPAAAAALTQRLTARLVERRLGRIYGLYGLHRSSVPFGGSAPSSYLRSRTPIPAAELPVRRRFASVVASFSSGGGDGGSGGFDGGEGGGNGSDGGDAKSNLAAGGAEEVSAVTTDVIILDVGGMTCGGCAASVKRILESQPQVSSASVNLATETAIVWPVAEAKVVPNWQQQLGEALAKHLTTCGFKSNLRVAGEGEAAIEGDLST